MDAFEEHKLTRPQFFREDVVRSTTNSSLIGMLAKVGGDSDSSSSSSDDENDDDEAESRVPEGSARVCWLDAEEATEKLSYIRVVDRYFSHGDIVAAVSNPLGQTGTVTRIAILADLKFPNGDIVTSVDAQRLRRIRPFIPGDYVVHGQRLSRVDEIVEDVTVLFDDGAKCKVLRADSERLVPVSKAAFGDSGYPYYPGLRVKAASSSLFRGARWLRGRWNARRREAIVTNVETSSVLVYWIASASPLETSQALVLSEQHDPSSLVALTHFSHTNWQLGDRALPPKDLKSRDCDSEAGVENDLPHSAAEGYTALQGIDNAGVMAEMPKDNWIRNHKLSRAHSVKREKRKMRRRKSEVEVAALITDTRTMIDVTWQDGSRSLNISACSLIPVGHPVDHDFWPEQYVLERGSEGEEVNTQVKRVGIVKSVDSEKRIAKVRWFKPVLGPEVALEWDAEETTSVYDLIEHRDFNYCLADVVIRLSLAPDAKPPRAIESVFIDSDARSSVFDQLSEHEGQGNEAESSEKQGAVKHRNQKREDCQSGYQDLAWVGVITGLNEGEIEVAWANGMVSKVGPQEIFIVSRDDDELSTLTSEVEDVDDAASWETVDSSQLNELNQDEQLKEITWSTKMSWEPSIESEAVIDCEQSTQFIGETSEDTRDDLVSEKRVDSVDSRPARYGGPLRFPLAAIGFIMSRFSDSLLGLRGKRKICDVNGAQSSLASNAKKMSNQARFSEVIPTGDEGNTNLQQISQPDPPAINVKDGPNTWIQVRGNVGAENDKGENIMLSGSGISTISESESTNKLKSMEINYKPESEDDDDDDDDDDFAIENCENSEPLTASFKQFDIALDAKDHHCYSKTGEASSQRKWVKKIHKEWDILEKGLPDTIFVRVFEERMDLLRAVIVGAAGTPYHDGLFVFDIYLPPEYPSVAPVAYYQSGGLRLNPNLYENGNVCLSLLNTWSGKGVEVWNPSSSSILQVLVSIQGLVLNAKPYFNEAGYDRQVDTAEGERNSLAYNENAFLLSCKSMLYLLHRPPKHFEKLIQNHFKARGSHILSACQAYLSGTTLVGSFSDAATTAKIHSDSQYGSSEGFKLMLIKLLPRLTTAFAEVGAFYENS